MSLDAFFNRVYNKESYNCAHFVCDVWESITGNSIDHKLECFLVPSASRHAGFSLRKEFRKLKHPESPCIVLMQRKGNAPHVGLFVRGKVIHIHETGVEFQPVDVASRGFSKIGYYAC